MSLSFFWRPKSDTDGSAGPPSNDSFWLCLQMRSDSLWWPQHILLGAHKSAHQRQSVALQIQEMSGAWALCHGPQQSSWPLSILSPSPQPGLLSPASSIFLHWIFLILKTILSWPLFPSSCHPHFFALPRTHCPESVCTHGPHCFSCFSPVLSRMELTRKIALSSWESLLAF